jgi:hypothetical protein
MHLSVVALPPLGEGVTVGSMRPDRNTGQACVADDRDTDRRCVLGNRAAW